MGPTYRTYQQPLASMLGKDTRDGFNFTANKSAHGISTATHLSLIRSGSENYLHGIPDCCSCSMTLDVVGLAHALAQPCFAIRFPDHCFLAFSTRKSNALSLSVAKVRHSRQPAIRSWGNHCTIAPLAYLLTAVPRMIERMGSPSSIALLNFFKYNAPTPSARP